MEQKQYSTPQFDFIRRDETDKVFFQTSGGTPSVGSVGLSSMTIDTSNTTW